MKTKEFKQYLRDNKEKLRGCSTNVSYKGEKVWFKTLNDLGTYLLTILSKDSYCVVSNHFGNAFTIMDKEPSNVLQTMTERQMNEGIYNQLKSWGTTV
ncbi:hypothetical protein N1F78_11620 [Seonamhaeicola sp. MEBiC1930]|uniref:hypothetical protein n=1 Tax=Seonamhaeicola sp. MEBiC01930 TaxID=2976768 RepID=UPI0032476888